MSIKIMNMTVNISSDVTICWKRRVQRLLSTRDSAYINSHSLILVNVIQREIAAAAMKATIRTDDKL
jgi:hypothetical protein